MQASEIDDIKAGSMHLSLKDTIFRTLENNLTIAVEDFNSKVKSENMNETLSEFDATFEIDLSVDEKTQQQASAFSSPNKSRSKNYNWDFSLTQKLITGADYEFRFKNGRNKSNSKTLGFHNVSLLIRGFKISNSSNSLMKLDLNSALLKIIKSFISFLNLLFSNK